MLSSVPKLEEFVHVVDESRRGMVEDVIAKFKIKVLEHMDDFPRQMIHGDFNEQNIIVSKGSSGDYKIAGVLDFGDSQHSCLLFEIAIALTYIMLITGEIESGGFFLAGYRMNRLIPDNEMKVLKVFPNFLEHVSRNIFLCISLSTALCVCTIMSKFGTGALFSSIG